jgi:fructose-1,6-bisphosphatase/inositol monophosphatase family enzyme
MLAGSSIAVAARDDIVVATTYDHLFRDAQYFARKKNSALLLPAIRMTAVNTPIENTMVTESPQYSPNYDW